MVPVVDNMGISDRRPIWTVERCYLYNMPREGIEFTWNYPTIREGALFNTANGNGYHLAEPS